MAAGLTAGAEIGGRKAEADRLCREGEELLVARKLAGALVALTRAEEMGAAADQCAGARWHCWMLLGEMERAWRESDAIRARGTVDAHRLWDGSDPTGKRVMVRSLHGFGDAVQNLRFLPALRRLASEVSVEVAPELLELARYFPGADEVITWGQDAPVDAPAYDMQVEVTELPYLLRCGLDDVARDAAYLRLPEAAVAACHARIGRRTRPRVGLVWTSSQWDVSRSIPFASVEALLVSEDCEFWSLQMSAENAPWRRWCEERGWPYRAAGEGSAVETAAFLTQMDLLVSVDTFVAHLAGALGRPVWLLLKQDADWRWGVARDDSAWYPTMRLFRQRERGDWTPVLREVRRCLRQWRADWEETCAGLE